MSCTFCMHGSCSIETVSRASKATKQANERFFFLFFIFLFKLQQLECARESSKKLVVPPHTKTRTHTHTHTKRKSDTHTHTHFSVTHSFFKVKTAAAAAGPHFTLQPFGWTIVRVSECVDKNWICSNELLALIIEKQEEIWWKSESLQSNRLHHELALRLGRKLIVFRLCSALGKYLLNTKIQLKIKNYSNQHKVRTLLLLFREDCKM